ncbi:DUF1772 domain-containing protein [Bacillus carboniphilus]|uniref:DUF1772 domain-containing protein n=1 Tax=Bacillus carboniphilus TaxID=86663 RepID=A0ABY9JSF6_9BACI|nr:DUF1772 domain-containing protein [Bacillus carboniphilus]WLR42334.1 DUF1772 domain-containing protein [Bacillus carboniphilus]
MIRYLENGTLALALFITGIMAGFFYTYTFNVNLAMLQVDGETYATVQSLFNENVRHVMFFIFFFGGGAISVITVIANIRHYKTISFWLMVTAGLIYMLGIIVFTANVNLPLNYETESWNPQSLPSDWQQIRNDWNQANAFRVIFSTLSFILYIIVLVIRSIKIKKI